MKKLKANQVLGLKFVNEKEAFNNRKLRKQEILN